jgi:hypothetical protein
MLGDDPHREDGDRDPRERGRPGGERGAGCGQRDDARGGNPRELVPDEPDHGWAF